MRAAVDALMADYTPETGDTVVVTLKPIKLTWAGDGAVETNNWFLDMDDIESITKANDLLPTKVGSVVRGALSGLYFLTVDGWVGTSGKKYDTIGMGPSEMFLPVTLVE